MITPMNEDTRTPPISAPQAATTTASTAVTAAEMPAFQVENLSIWYGAK